MIRDHESRAAGAAGHVEPAAGVPGARGHHARRLIVPLVLAVGMIAGASAIVTTGVGCGDPDDPPPDGGLTDGDVDTPIV